MNKSIKTTSLSFCLFAVAEKWANISFLSYNVRTSGLCASFSWRNLKERDGFEDLSIDAEEYSRS